MCSKSQDIFQCRRETILLQEIPVHKEADVALGSQLLLEFYFSLFPIFWVLCNEISTQNFELQFYEFMIYLLLLL